MRSRKWLFLWLPVPVLLWWALRNVSLGDLFSVMRTIQPGLLMFLVLVNLLILLLFSSRWWMILRSMGYGIPYMLLSAYRIAGFGVSYITPGTQFGGEPVQTILVSRRHAVPTERAVASIYLDKTFEVLSNFTFLVIGLWITLWHGVTLAGAENWAWLLVLAIMIFPAAHLAALGFGRLPVSWLLRKLPPLWQRKPGLQRVASLIERTEQTISEFFRCQPGTLWAAIGLSLLIWLVMIFEYSLALKVLGLPMDWVHTMIIMTAGRIAILMPVPGALGALETSQVLAMQALGYDPAVGIVLSLMIRGRDLLVAGGGLLLTAWALSSRISRLV